jgi:hypothetical protein
MESSGSITLGEVAERTAVLAVACTRCERAGWHNLGTLTARHGLTSESRICWVCCPTIVPSGNRSPLTIGAAFIAQSCPPFHADLDPTIQQHPREFFALCPGTVQTTETTAKTRSQLCKKKGQKGNVLPEQAVFSRRLSLWSPSRVALVR